MLGASPSKPIRTIFGTLSRIMHEINCSKFNFDRSRGCGLGDIRKSHACLWKRSRTRHCLSRQRSNWYYILLLPCLPFFRENVHRPRRPTDWGAKRRGLQYNYYDVNKWESVKSMYALQYCCLVSLFNLFHDGHYRKSIRPNIWLLLKSNFIANFQQHNTDHHFTPRRARGAYIIITAGVGLQSFNAQSSHVFGLTDLL